MTTNLFQGPFLAVPLWASEEIRDHGQPRDLQVLVALVALMERRTKEVTASINQISDYLQISRKTVQRSLSWMEDYGVITTTRRGRPSVNVYRINYTRPVVTTNRVTHDPLIGSPMTLSTGTLEGSIGSPMTLLNGPFSMADQGICEISIEVIPKGIEIEVLERAAGGKEGTVIIGADPDKPEQTFEPEAKKKPKRNLNRLVNLFMSDPRSIMSSTYSYRDSVILRRTFNTLIDSGLTEFTVSQMVKRFLDVEHWRTADNPVLLFSSKAIQQKLMEQVDTTIVVDDPILAFIMNDFERGDIALPWKGSDQDRALKKSVIMNGLDVCYRYPELVAQLIAKFSGDVSTEFSITLSALNSMVRILSGEETGDLAELQNSVAMLDLPPELLKSSGSNLRQAASSIQEAVYNYRRVSHGK
jgi:predicted transcriptional regulator